MLLGACSFAAMGTLTHAMGERVDWLTIVVWRVIVQLVIFGGSALAAGVKLHLWKPRHLWTRSLAGSMSLLCVMYAFTRLPVSIAFTLCNLYPVWVALLSALLLRRHASRSEWTAILIAVLGVVISQQPQFAEGNYAALAALAGSMLSSISLLGLHELRTVDVRPIVFHFSLVSLVFCLTFAQLTGSPITEHFTWSPQTALLLTAIGVAASAGQFFLTLAFATGPPARVSVVGLTQVGFGALLETIFWGWRLSPVSVAGMILAIAPTGWLLWSARSQPAPADVVVE